MTAAVLYLTVRSLQGKPRKLKELLEEL